MDFLKYPFFNKTYGIATAINKKYLKNVSVLSLALLSVCFSLIYIGFIFFIGLGKFVPDIFVNNPDIRNLFISIIHTFSALFGILYASFYIDKSLHDGKIISPAIATVIVLAINLFLAWRCYFLNELDILVYVITTDGFMFSLFLLLLSIFQYDIISNKTSRRYLNTSISKTLIIIAMILFPIAILTYYDYLSMLIMSFYSKGFSPFQTDALVLFLYMIANLCLVTAIILMYNIEHKINIMLKELAERASKKSAKE